MAKKKMEDPNLLAADCIVICTCCPCLIIQVLAVIFIRLPQKLAKKAKRAVLVLLFKKRRCCSTCSSLKKKRMMRVHSCNNKVVRESESLQQRDGGGGGAGAGAADDDDDISNFWAAGGNICGGNKSFSCPIDAADEVFKELYDLGVLGFGDFGRRSRHQGNGPAAGHDPETRPSGCGTCVWVAYS